LPDLVPGELFFGEDFVEIGVGVDEVHGQAGQFARRDPLLGMSIAGRVAERGFAETDLLPPLVHHAREVLLASGDPFGSGDGGVVSGLHDDAAQEID
jgi:hypothetical protein